MSDEREQERRVFSPVGERGPHGDTGETGAEGEKGKTGIHGLQGPAGLQGVPGPEGNVVVLGKSRVAQILLGIAALMFVVSLVLSQIFSWSRVENLERQVDDYASVQIDNRAVEMCQSLYRNDLTTAIGQALAANNSLWVAIASREAALTEEQRIEAAEENQRLGEILSEQNRPLQNAIDALNGYILIDPPPHECPHPAAQRHRGFGLFRDWG